MSREFDFVVFGATGFTGQFVVEELAKVAAEKNKKWAVAGRNEGKLKGVLEEAKKATGKDLSKIQIIIADISDPESLAAMAKRTKVVLNCVGPYRLYGEQAVKACVENGASHVDVSGEPAYLEKMQVKYDEMAKEKKVYVVGACGWDSIPFEMGLVFTQQSFPGELNSVEGVIEPKIASGYKIHYGTFESMIEGFANAKELKPIRKALMPNRPQTSHFKLSQRGPIFKNEGTDGWCMPFLGSDRSIGMRSQYYSYHQQKRRPIQLQAYIQFSNLFWAVATILWGIMFGIMASFEATRKLLKSYPEILSFGLFSHQGPTREQMAKTKFNYWFYGKGWQTKLGADKEHDEGPTEKIITKVEGPDIGYLSTAIFIVGSAMTILEEADKMPENGGVYPPGAAFEKTSLIKRLKERGIKFEMMECSLIKEKKGREVEKEE